MSPQGAGGCFLLGKIHGAAYIEISKVRLRKRLRPRERGAVAVGRKKEMRASVISWYLESCIFVYKGALTIHPCCQRT